MHPAGIVAGPDKRLWYPAPIATAVAAIDPFAGDPEQSIVEYPILHGPNTPPAANKTVGPSGIAASNGSVWFTERNGFAVGRLPVEDAARSSM